MRLFLIAILLAAGATTLMPQATAIYPPIEINYQSLKAYLNLSDAQLQSLENIQTTKNQAQQGILQQMNQKQQQLNALLQANSTDATQVGQLTLEINALRKQLPAPFEPYHSQALAILTPDQQTKLAALQTALQLSGTASQAVMLSLIAPLPPVTGPVPLAASLVAHQPF
jgi:chromosome segregation ATPase